MTALVDLTNFVVSFVTGAVNYGCTVHLVLQTNKMLWMIPWHTLMSSCGYFKLGQNISLVLILAIGMFLVFFFYLVSNYFRKMHF